MPGWLLFLVALAAPPETPMADPTHLAVTLEVPYHPWQASYDLLAADADAAPHLARMRTVLEAGGAPEERLKALATEATATRVAVAGEGPSPLYSAVDRVALDLHVAFYKDLAAAIAGAALPVAERVDALERLRRLVAAPPPVGIRDPQPTSPWAAMAKVTADTEIRVQIETISAE